MHIISIFVITCKYVIISLGHAIDLLCHILIFKVNWEESIQYLGA